MPMETAYLCDAIRTPIGRYGGTLAAICTNDLAAIPISALMKRNASVDWGAVDDVVFGCANQAGEDNRNVARMALLLSGLPKEVPGTTVNRLCGSSMDAVATAARAIKSGEAELVIAGGVESMSRAPFVMGKADSAYSRSLRSQQRAAEAIRGGRLKQEIIPVPILQKKGDALLFSEDEHPRPDTTLEALAKLKPVVKPDGTITAGNASGIND